MSTTTTPAEGHSGWLRSLAPYAIMVIGALVGIAYTSSRMPGPDGSAPKVLWVWVALVPLYFGACVWQGWSTAKETSGVSRLVISQALHWAAFVGAMMVMLSSTVRGVLNDNSLGLVLLMLLALGTFVAGVHAWSLPICLTGLVLALATFIVAWFEQSVVSIVLILGGAALVALLLVVQRRRAGAASLASPPPT